MTAVIREKNLQGGPNGAERVAVKMQGPSKNSGDARREKTITKSEKNNRE